MLDGDLEHLREYEKYLDEHHKTLGLWKDPRAMAIYAVLAVHDALSIVPTLSDEPPQPDASDAQESKAIEEGVSQAIRWLCQGDQEIVVSSECTDSIFQNALAYVAFAAQYVHIADFHIAHGRGLADVQIDRPTKTVTFTPTRSGPVTSLLGMHEQIYDQSIDGIEAALQTTEAQYAHARSVAQSIGYSLYQGRIVLGSLPDDYLIRLGTLVVPIEAGEILPLADSIDLCGFTASAFRSFCRAVMAWSMTATFRFAGCIRNHIRPTECMPIQIVPQAFFCEQIGRLSNLAVDTVSAICDRLTLVPSNKADVLLTPFLRGQGNICWSPAMFTKLRHERNLLKTMARSAEPLRSCAATIIGNRDRQLGRMISNVFSRRGYQFKLNGHIGSDEDNLDIDVLLYTSRAPREVLLVEAKALLSPDEVNEVYDAGEKVKHAQTQLDRAKHILQAMSAHDKANVYAFVDWSKVETMSGVVVANDAEMIGDVDQRTFPVVSCQTLRRRFRARDFNSPRAFHRAAVEREWLVSEVDLIERTSVDIKVGSIVYRIPSVEVEYNAPKMITSGLSLLAR